MKEHIVVKVRPGSIAEELEVKTGDMLVSVDGHEIEDIALWRYQSCHRFLVDISEP